MTRGDEMRTGNKLDTKNNKTMRPIHRDILMNRPPSDFYFVIFFLFLSGKLKILMRFYMKTTYNICKLPAVCGIVFFDIKVLNHPLI